MLVRALRIATKPPTLTHLEIYFYDGLLNPSTTLITCVYPFGIIAACIVTLPVEITFCAASTVASKLEISELEVIAKLIAFSIKPS